MNNSYRIEVKDFGPIVRANVDFRPLTVFIGPSNTGKSYLAVLLYALHQCLGGMDAPFRTLGIQRRMYRPSVHPTPFSNKVEKSWNDWLAAVSKGDSFPEMPRNLVEAIRSILEEAKDLDLHLRNRILQSFGVQDVGELVRRPGSSTNFHIALNVPQAGKSDAVRYQFQFGSSESKVSGRIPATESSPWIPDSDLLKDFVSSVNRTDLQEFGSEFVTGFVLRDLLSKVFQSLIRPAGRKAYYLPADRTGVMHSHQVVVSAIVQNASMIGLQPTVNVPMLSGVLADFLTLMIGIRDNRRSRTRGGKPVELAAPLEGNLLGGTVRVENSETGYPNFTYRPKDWQNDLPLMRASSMVSELAPVVLYLRHIVRSGDVLIIEEPESHLHPAMQAAFARELARLVHAGVRIVMTTHSEWFLEQIGNLVRLADLPRTKRRGLEATDYALNPDDVGAWLFKPSNRPKGSVVEEITLDPETGLYPAGYDLVSEALYNEGATIYNRIQESK